MPMADGARYEVRITAERPDRAPDQRSGGRSVIKRLAIKPERAVDAGALAAPKARAIQRTWRNW